MKIQENIRRLRKDRKLSQTDLAEAIGVSTAAISSYETGAHVPPLDVIQLLATFFHVPIVDITGDDREYYMSDTTAALAQELFDNPDLRMLLDAGRKAKPEDIQMAAEMLRRLSAYFSELQKN